MALDACNDAISKALGRELSDREKGAISRRALELKRKIDAAGGDDLAVESVLGSFGKDIATQQAVRRRNAAINFRVGEEKWASYKSSDFGVQRPDEYLRGMYIQSQKDYFGAKASLGTAQAREAASRSGAFRADLMKNGLFDYAYKSNDHRNQWLARAALNDPNTDVGELAQRYGDDAVKFAQIARKHQEVSRSERNLAGAWIGGTPDYVTTQTHDSYLIARAGGGRFGQSYDAWRSKLGELDWDKSFDGEYANAPEAKREELLRSQYNQFVSGKHLSFGGGNGAANIAGRASHTRQFVFKTPEDAFNYWNEFGKHGSLAESIDNELSRAGRDIATMREWGPNARANMLAFHKRMEADVKTHGTVEQSRAFDSARAKAEKNYIPALLDEIGNPDTAFAHWSATARQAIFTAKTGASLPASIIGDPALRSFYAMRYAGRSGSIGNMLTELASAWKGLVAPEVDGLGRADLAGEWGIRLHDLNLPLGTEYQERAGVGAISKWTQFIQKTLGHSWSLNRQRTNHLAAEGFRDWKFSNRSYEELPSGRQQLMQQFGITSKMWDIIRRSEPMQLSGSNKMSLSPSAVRAMDVSEFKEIANGDSDAALKRARDLVADRYRNMHGELADTAVSEPNRNMRAIIYGPTASMSPWQRELYRSFFGLKNFMANFMRNHLGGVALGQDADPNNVGWAKAMVRTFAGVNGGNALKMMATMLFTGQMLGYVRDALGDVINNKTPENPFDFESKDGNIMNSPGYDAGMRAFAFQTMGLLSDFVVSKGEKPGADIWDKIGGMAGPELETAGDITDEVGKLAGHIGKYAASKNYSSEDFYRDLSKDASGFARTAYGSVPGNNILWTKWATDALLLDNLMEALNPGYKKRLQQRMQKHGQTPIIDMNQ